MSDSDLGVALPQPRSPHPTRTPSFLNEEARFMEASYEGSTLVREGDHLVSKIDYERYDHEARANEWIDIWWSDDKGQTWTEGKARATSNVVHGGGDDGDGRIYTTWSPGEWMTTVPDGFDDWPEADKAAWLDSDD